MGAPLSSFRPDHAIADQNKNIFPAHTKVEKSFFSLSPDTWIMWVFNAHASQNLCMYTRVMKISWCEQRVMAQNEDDFPRRAGE